MALHLTSQVEPSCRAYPHSTTQPWHSTTRYPHTQPGFCRNLCNSISRMACSNLEAALKHFCCHSRVAQDCRNVRTSNRNSSTKFSFSSERNPRQWRQRCKDKIPAHLDIQSRTRSQRKSAPSPIFSKPVFPSSLCACPFRSPNFLQRQKLPSSERLHDVLARPAICRFNLPCAVCTVSSCDKLCMESCNKINPQFVISFLCKRHVL